MELGARRWVSLAGLLTGLTGDEWSSWVLQSHLWRTHIVASPGEKTEQSGNTGGISYCDVISHKTFSFSQIKEGKRKRQEGRMRGREEKEGWERKVNKRGNGGAKEERIRMRENESRVWGRENGHDEVKEKEEKAGTLSSTTSTLKLLSSPLSSHPVIGTLLHLKGFIVARGRSYHIRKARRPVKFTTSQRLENYRLTNIPALKFFRDTQISKCTENVSSLKSFVFLLKCLKLHMELITCSCSTAALHETWSARLSLSLLLYALLPSAQPFRY